MTHPPVDPELATAIAQDRRAFVLQQQDHCRRYLAPLAEPEGKRVLVVGSGAGTEMLWCLSEGAVEVVGIDLKPQPMSALEDAAASLGVDIGRASVHQLRIEDARDLDRHFDLIVSNNVFEHLADLPTAFAVCRDLLRPGGRLAIFTDPLFASSTGSHLEHVPWEHLWGDPAALSERLTPSLPDWHPLHWTDLQGFFQEVGLNRMRTGDLLDAIRSAGLLVLRFETLADRSLDQLSEQLPALREVLDSGDLTLTDLSIEGVAMELARAPEALGDDVDDWRPTSERRDADGAVRAEDFTELLERHEALRAEHDRLAGVLQATERSVSLRLGRLLTAVPRRLVRWVRGR